MKLKDFEQILLEKEGKDEDTKRYLINLKRNSPYNYYQKVLSTISYCFNTEDKKGTEKFYITSYRKDTYSPKKYKVEDLQDNSTSIYFYTEEDAEKALKIMGGKIKYAVI